MSEDGIDRSEERDSLGAAAQQVVEHFYLAYEQPMRAHFARRGCTVDEIIDIHSETALQVAEYVAKQPDSFIRCCLEGLQGDDPSLPSEAESYIWGIAKNVYKTYIKKTVRRRQRESRYPEEGPDAREDSEDGYARGHLAPADAERIPTAGFEEELVTRLDFQTLLRRVWDGWNPRHRLAIDLQIGDELREALPLTDAETAELEDTLHRYDWNRNARYKARSDARQRARETRRAYTGVAASVAG